jgi:RNA polymerase sigma-70 factor (ECF subfamily)
MDRSVEVAAGSGDTLEEMYREYRERLFRFVLPRVNGDAHVAEDVVQEAFAAALLSLARFRSNSSPYTWLCSIAQHKIADHFRKQRPTGGEILSLDLLAEGPEEGEQHSSPVEAWLDTKDTRDTVQQALRELPPAYGDVLRYKYFDGLSVAEIGSEIGRSPKAVEGLLARARRALSASLVGAVHA